MQTQPALEACRHFFAQELRVLAEIDSDELVSAFALVPREQYLGPAPWSFGTHRAIRKANYRVTSEARDLYHDVFVALESERGLNNGQPSMIARLIRTLRLTRGQRVLHVGCGTGYYTAIMAEVVGALGRVTAVEIDPYLAGQATANLVRYPQVQVVSGDGASFSPEPVDSVLVNASVTRPHGPWLTQLAQNGVLVLPLAAGMFPESKDAMFVELTRKGDRFHADFIALETIYRSPSLHDPAIQAAFNQALQSRTITGLRSVRIDEHPPEQTCIVHQPGFCLSTLPV